ncbi:MAG: pantoate--beta-alanine ligase [Desulfotomaculum sp.]|nr:pantoate--beta-alanine ligase [Desulfotomaculum sp.]
MLILKTITEIKNFTRKAQAQNKSTGLVPTMGYLHPGHLALVKKAVEQCDLVVVSIYVNPLQFGPREDLAAYPRDLERDSQLLQATGVDVLFIPSDKEVYPSGHNTTVTVGAALTGKLCGSQRPGHFTGVATVVTKLFNIVRPERAYFGQKDAQQVLVIQRVVQDLNMDTEIIVVPTVRESDGLARSSRNIYLNPAERQAAVILSKSLQLAQKVWQQGQRDAATICSLVIAKINTEPLAKPEYVQVYAYPDLQAVEQLNGTALLALAVRFGKTRLIDNLILEG